MLLGRFIDISILLILLLCFISIIVLFLFSGIPAVFGLAISIGGGFFRLFTEILYLWIRCLFLILVY